MDAQYESFIFSYEDYKESNVRRNRLTSSSRITMASDARNALRKSQQVKIRHRVGSDAITEAVCNPSSSSASSPKNRSAQTCWPEPPHHLIAGVLRLKHVVSQEFELTIVQTSKKGAFCRKLVVCFKSVMFSPVCLEVKRDKYCRPQFREWAHQ